jgi:hypothetical protein
MKETNPLEFRWTDSHVEVDLDDRFSLRIGSGTKAQVLKTSSLQKGMILTFDGREIVDEGMGFGVPVIKYRDNMYYSKDANMIRSDKKNVVRKIFRMNGIERVRVGKLRKIEFPSPAMRFLAGASMRFLAGAYTSSNFFGKKIAQVDQALRKHADIETEFVAVKERGEVSVTYEISSHRIHVECDLTHLEKDTLQKIFILNEQGSSFFRQYSD